jgi:hypothetical protein
MSSATKEQEPADNRPPDPPIAELVEQIRADARRWQADMERQLQKKDPRPAAKPSSMHDKSGDVEAGVAQANNNDQARPSAA